MRRSKRFQGHETTYAWLMSAPALIGLFLFVALPLFGGVYWSFTNKRLISPLPTKYVGFQNYQNLLGLQIVRLEPEIDPATSQVRIDAEGNKVFPSARSIVRNNPAYQGFRQWFSFDGFGNRYVVIAKDPTFLRALINTFIFVMVIVPGQGGLALVMALLVNHRLRGRYVFRTIYFSPVVTSMAVLAIVWTFLYNPDQGFDQSLSERSYFWKVPARLVDQRPIRPPLAIIILSAWQAAGIPDGHLFWQDYRASRNPYTKRRRLTVAIPGSNFGT